MFDQILDLVKQHVGNNPEVASTIPAGQVDAVHHEIANQVTHGLASQAASQGGVGGLMSMLQGGGTSSGNPITSAIAGGVVSTLGNKFGLPPAATGAIAAALPGLLQKFANKAADPNDHSITPDNISESISRMGAGGLGSLGNLGGLFK
ncbi:DUF937 domain-containing protein [Rufibacter latericius]|uniref:DUF937 domain-containing protein n=1 Tax=Rufibacter latericius TaxID=2487040 RepID=A0A3M9N126_9BACT|nr:DUF937 domain-containing protein [Rufibacter latericius]RNI31426.1 hypothetical protein EFB08_02570 [Rufibacter latericius]